METPGHTHPAQLEPIVLEGAYSEQDIRLFSAFLAKRVAGTKLWALGIFMLLPLVYAGNFRQAWPVLVPVGLALVGFVFVLRFVILPRKLYTAATRLPGVFETRRITIDTMQVDNRSESGGHTFQLEDIKEIVESPGHLFVMVAPKQGIPIPRAWIGDEARERELIERLQSRMMNH